MTFSPGLAYDAMLKMTGVRLELMIDLDMHLFMEAGIRGGVAVITHRHAIAENVKLLHANYDPKKSSTFIISLDGVFTIVLINFH